MFIFSSLFLLSWLELSGLDCLFNLPHGQEPVLFLFLFFEFKHPCRLSIADKGWLHFVYLTYISFKRL
jgi:hypothetical protein